MSILVKGLQHYLLYEKKLNNDIRQNLEEERKRNDDLVSRISFHLRETANVEIERDLLKRKSFSHEERLKDLL